MPIKTFTDEEKAAIKAESTTRFQGRAMVCNFADPIHETIVVAPFDRASYQAFWHGKIKDKQSAYATAWVERRLFPSLADMASLQQQWAALPEMLAERLDEEADGRGGTVTAAPWAAPTEQQEAAVMATAVERGAPPDWTGLLPRGLTLEAARTLAGPARGPRLWLVQDASFAVVMRTPEPMNWVAASGAWDAAMKKGKGAIDAADPFVAETVVWSSEPLIGGAGLFDRHPGLWFNLWAAYKRMGGEGAAARTFLL